MVRQFLHKRNHMQMPTTSVKKGGNHTKYKLGFINLVPTLSHVWSRKSISKDRNVR